MNKQKSEEIINNINQAGKGFTNLKKGFDEFNNAITEFNTIISQNPRIKEFLDNGGYIMEYTNENFEEMRNQMINHINNNLLTQDYLFTLDIDSDELYELYLDSFPNEIKGIYRERAWHDCSACKYFIRQMGGVVAINSTTQITTIWDFPTIPEYQECFKILSEYLQDKLVKEILIKPQNKIGVYENFEQQEDGVVVKHSHLYCELPSKFVKKGILINKLKGEARTNKEVLKNSLKSINDESLETVIELIESNSLYRGQQWLSQLKKFKEIHNEYYNLCSTPEMAEIVLDRWLWVTSCEVGTIISKIKNHSIGVLLQDLTNNVPLEDAVKKYEDIVAPTNYQRPKPLYTKQMLEQAKNKLTELGYLDSITRRFARLSDIKVTDVLFANRNVTSKLKQDTVEDLFEELDNEAVRKVQNFDRVEEIPVDAFLENILPKCTEISLYLENGLINNFVSLISPINSSAKSMFKWDNCFSWTYRNNITDSLMKDLVKSKGGDVDVDLRFSIQWNDTVWDRNDLDAHCTEPNGNEIYYPITNKRSRYTGGWLDVDIVSPKQNEIAVENIRYKHKTDMLVGDYLFRVHQYTYRGGDTGFSAEVEFDNTIHSFYYPHKLVQNGYVDVAKVYYDGKNFTLTPLIENSVQANTTWNLPTNEFVPVNLICYSPNHWGENNVGNKHLFFMLKDCINPDNPNGWFNEFLNEELREHRKVMEALSSKTKVEDTPDQLSGIGLSLTQHKTVTLKIKTENIERIIKIKT